MCTHAHFNDTGGLLPARAQYMAPSPPPTERRTRTCSDSSLSMQKDPNYTVRRQQFQMNRILEKNKHAKQVERERGREGEKMERSKFIALLT